MKKNFLVIIFATIVIIMSLSFKNNNTPNFSNVPPTGFTGQIGKYCTSCHITNSLNQFGGSVQINGLPEGNYNIATTYNFSLSIFHSAADRKRWGFAITAVNNVGENVGTFSTTNPNAQVGPKELTHKSVPYLSLSSSFTYTNLTWLSPSTQNTANSDITFFIACNAANGDGDNTGDFIYSKVLKAKFTTVPATLINVDVIKDNKSAIINWNTNTETNTKFFLVEKSFDSINYTPINKLNAAGNSTTNKTYTFRDDSKNSGKIFYRITTVNVDETKSFSGTRSVLFDFNDDENKLYPNPLTISNVVRYNLVSAKNQPLNYKIFTSEGRLIIYKTINVNQGSNIVVIDLNTIVKQSIVFIKFYIDGKVITKKLIMKN